jgi:hypothetical protein
MFFFFTELCADADSRWRVSCNNCCRVNNATAQRETRIRRQAMIGVIVQLTIVGMWAATLIIHTRRLLRLAQLETLEVWHGKRLRGKLTRVWWWLGREEYWRGVQVDGVRCVQMTLMVFMMAWGIYA